MAKFRKGDKVRANENRSWKYIEIGDIGTIDENDSVTPSIIWDKNHQRYCMAEDSLTLINPTCPKTINYEIY